MIKIFVTEKDYEEYEITNLYWFEENTVHWFDDSGFITRVVKFRVEIWRDGELICQEIIETKSI